MLKAAMIGAGFIADFHADGYAQLPDVSLAAICDTDENKAAAMADQYHCKAYASAEEMLTREQPDLVSVCLPTFLHERYTLLALRAGAHVLCEKPLSLTMESCYRMAEAAKESGRILMTGQVLRWWPEYQTIAGEMRRLGPFPLIASKRLQYAGRTQWMPDPQKGGGVLFDLFVHDLDFLCAQLGYTPKVESAAGIMGPEGSWRSVYTMLTWPCGTTAKLEASNLMPKGFPFTAALRVDRKQACISYTFRAPVNIEKDAVTQTEFLLFENDTSRQLPLAENAQTQAFRQEIAAFVRGVQEGSSPLPVENTLAVMKIVHQVKDLLDRQREQTSPSDQ